LFLPLTRRKPTGDPKGVAREVEATLMRIMDEAAP